MKKECTGRPALKEKLEEKNRRLMKSHSLIDINKAVIILILTAVKEIDVEMAALGKRIDRIEVTELVGGCREKTERSIENIFWGWSGSDENYHVYLKTKFGDTELYTTKDARDKDLFIAQLKVWAFMKEELPT